MSTEPKTESKIEKKECRHDGEKTERSFESKTAYGVQTNTYCVGCGEFIALVFKEHRSRPDDGPRV